MNYRVQFLKFCCLNPYCKFLGTDLEHDGARVLQRFIINQRPSMTDVRRFARSKWLQAFNQLPGAVKGRLTGTCVLTAPALACIVAPLFPSHH